MDLASLWLALNIAFGGGQGPKFEGLDVGGSVVVDVPLGHLSRVLPGSPPKAVTLGPLILNDPRAVGIHADLIGHELEHVRQWEALGPAFLLAYTLGGGREFEDYLGDGTMWAPEEDMKRWPVLSYSPERGVQFMPAFRLGKGE